MYGCLDKAAGSHLRDGLILNHYYTDLLNIIKLNT